MLLLFRQHLDKHRINCELVKHDINSSIIRSILHHLPFLPLLVQCALVGLEVIVTYSQMEAWVQAGCHHQLSHLSSKIAGGDKIMSLNSY